MSAGPSVVLAYAIGCVSFAALVARLRGVDIRAHGSGNPGATNVGRVLGPAWGRLVLLLDIAKGFVPVLLLRAPPDELGLPAGLVPWGVDGDGRVLVAVAVVLGHVWPVTARFRGGKGVATLVGGALGLDPVLGLLAVAVHLGIKRLTGFVSLASVILAWSLPLAQLLLRATGAGESRFVGGTGTLAVLALLVTLRHRANFARMRAGAEDRYDDPDHVPHGMSERDGEGRSPR